MRFDVEKEVFEVLKDMCIGVVYAEGIDNRQANAEIGGLLAASIDGCIKKTAGVSVKEMAEIGYYRDAFRLLGMNPNKFMCSIEALTSRVAKKGELPSINPVVDLVNALSLKYYVAMGAHDAATFTGGKMSVRYSREKDRYITFNNDEQETIDAHELVYVTGSDVRTRRWIWRQSENGKIGPESSNILFPVDGFAQNKESVLAASRELARLLEELFRCRVQTGWIDKDQCFVEF